MLLSHTWTALLRLATLAAAVGAAAACHPTPPPDLSGSGNNPCAVGDIKGCEAALLAAPAKALPALLLAYDRARGTGDSWQQLWTALQVRDREQPRAALIHPEGAAPPAVEADLVVLPAAAHPEHATAAELLLALGAQAGRQHLILLPNKGNGQATVQLFPNDLLAVHALGLGGVVRSGAGRQQLSRDIALAAGVHRILAAARSFDYVAAADGYDQLTALVRQSQLWAEPALRARFALSLMRRAGLALAPAGVEEDEAGIEELAKGQALPAQSSSPYADYLVVQLAAEPAAAWPERRGRITAGMSPERVALLDDIFRPEGACTAELVPPMEQPSDALFASRLAVALNRAEPGSEGKLELADWLSRYQALIRLVSEHGLTWWVAPSLLYERGELHGLSAADTTSYRLVSDLVFKHLVALQQLVKQRPQRFQAFTLLLLALQRGLLTDRRLLAVTNDLLQLSVELKLGAAQDVDGLLDAGLTAFLASMSYPPAMQGAQLEALREGLGARLTDDVFRPQTGWGMAGLHAAYGVLSLVTGKRQQLLEAAPRVAQALRESQDPAFASIRLLAASAASYAALIGSGSLDATVQNPKLLSPERQAARQSLEQAIALLTAGGPNGAAERELLAGTTAFADGLIATLAASFMEEQPAAGPSCPDSVAASKQKGPLGDSFERLLKGRRRLLESEAFKQGNGAWRQRVRLLITVLSDVLDVAATAGTDAERKLLVSHDDAQRIVEQALSEWQDRDLAEATSGGYLLLRALATSEAAGPGYLAKQAARLLSALGRAFKPDATAAARPSAASSLFDVLASVSTTVDPAAQGTAEIPQLLISLASQAYAHKANHHGDLLLFVALGIATAKEDPIPQGAVDLARRHGRPPYLPLLLMQHRRGEQVLGPLTKAIREAQAGHCNPPDPEGVITVQQALADFKAGQPEPALAALDRFLAESPRIGLVVPRLSYVYEESTRDKVFKVEGSLSLGGELLSKSGTFEVGLGIRSPGEPGGELRVSFASPSSRESLEETARYYAHVAALAAVLHFVQGHRERAIASAQRAIATWTIGTKLGETAVASGESMSQWTADASGTLAVAAQLAAEHGEAFLAADLWTLTRQSLGHEATDETVAAVLDPVPQPLAGVASLSPVVERARGSLAVVAAGLPCTSAASARVKSYQQNDCGTYPLALALRGADALPQLPRLKAGAQVGLPVCEAWQALDQYLVGADRKKPDPAAFNAAVAALRQHGRLVDAAILLARHHRQCHEQLVDHARYLATKEHLGPQLRADLITLAAKCTATAGPSLTRDLLLLDELTGELAVATRRFQVLVFAIHVGVMLDQWEALSQISARPDFVRRWLPYGPQLATTALLVHHAAAVSAGKPLGRAQTLPLYQLLCTTYPPAERGPMCNVISLLRGEATAKEKQQAAKQALSELLAQVSRQQSP